MKLCLGLLVIIFLGACTSPEILSSEVLEPRTYLPVIVKGTPKPLFCVENEDSDFDRYLADKLHSDCMAIAINWAIVERDGWDYTDSKVGSFDGLLQVQIVGAPTWITGAETCRPIPMQFVDALAAFTAEVMERYPNTFAIEWMNEPDVKSAWAEWWLGCWGDTYAEGVYYGEFVSAIYAKMKPEYPEITFIGGAFLRPDNEFTSGALSVMQADAASFHYYPFCGLASEYDYLYNVMVSRTNLPLWFGETALLYQDDAPENCPFEQADYVTELPHYQGVDAVIYYTIGCRPEGHEWNNSSIWGEAIPRTFQLGQYGAKFLFDDCHWKPAVEAYNSNK